MCCTCIAADCTCVAVCYSGLWCAAVCCSVLQCAAMCCSVLHMYCSVWHMCCSALQCTSVSCNVLKCAAVCCNVLQCAPMCCSTLQCVAHVLQYQRALDVRHYSRISIKTQHEPRRETDMQRHHCSVAARQRAPHTLLTVGRPG